MNYEQIKTRLAPCGLHCGKCFAFVEGDIKVHSNRLKESLGDFDIYAERFVDLLNEPLFRKYSDFKGILTYFATVDCGGCRNENCKLFKDCKVRDCHENMGVDFCFQCPEFPCNSTGFDRHLHQRSVDINRRMKKIGVEKYYEEIKDKPRY
nr:DUF3795 domain-containing protein [Bacteroidota bacterium]